MPTVLAISSWVAAGHVGLSAAAPVLQMLGAAVIQLPSIALSNHKAWGRVAGAPSRPEEMRAMLDAIEANGFLDPVDAVLTGYLPSAEHVAVAVEAVTRLRAGRPIRLICDPVMGDDPKGLYLAPDAAAALSDRLAPMADVLTPNRFELSRLTERPIDSLDQARAAAAALAAARPGRLVAATSAPMGAAHTGLLTMTADHQTALYRVRKHAAVPHGVGDVFAAMLAAGDAPGAALGKLQALIEASLGAPHLAIAASAEQWRRAPPIAPTPL